MFVRLIDEPTPFEDADTLRTFIAEHSADPLSLANPSVMRMVARAKEALTARLERDRTRPQRPTERG